MLAPLSPLKRGLLSATLCLSLGLLLWALVCGTPSAHGSPYSAVSSPLRLWAADGMTRIGRTDPVRDVQAVHIHAARNEWEPFQVIVRHGMGI